MSDNTPTRALLACEHGNFDCKEVVEWPLNTATNANDFIPRPCPGGREIVLRFAGPFPLSDAHRALYHAAAAAASVDPEEKSNEKERKMWVEVEHE